jgi:hypothetical protein
MVLRSFDGGVRLSDARASRDEARSILRSGRNPIDVRRDAERADQARRTFGEVADELLEAKARE